MESHDLGAEIVRMQEFDGKLSILLAGDRLLFSDEDEIRAYAEYLALPKWRRLFRRRPAGRL